MGCCPVWGGGSVVVDLFINTPIVEFCNCSMFCCTFLYVHSSFAIIMMGKRELVALLSLTSWCFVIVVWVFLVVPRVCLQFVIMVFPDHTHLLFLQHGSSCFCPPFYDIVRNRYPSILEVSSTNRHMHEIPILW